jgi:hypothetical protein
MRELTHCKHGHSLADAYVVHQRNTVTSNEIAARVGQCVRTAL